MFLFSKIYFISVYAIIKIENTNIFVALYTKILVIRHTRRRRRAGARKIKCYTRLRCYIHTCPWFTNQFITSCRQSAFLLNQCYRIRSLYPTLLEILRDNFAML